MIGPAAAPPGRWCGSLSRLPLARPHSVDLLLCGHHYRMSCAALAAAGAVIINDERGGGTSVNEHAPGDATASDTRRR